MKTTLQEAPFLIDAPAIAKGMLELFSDDERVALRFGMLPYEKMQILERALRDKFGATADGKGDQYTAICETPERRRIVDFSMKKLVNEAVHEVCLALYDIGELVV